MLSFEHRGSEATFPAMPYIRDTPIRDVCSPCQSTGPQTNRWFATNKDVAVTSWPNDLLDKPSDGSCSTFRALNALS